MQTLHTGSASGGREGHVKSSAGLFRPEEMGCGNVDVKLTVGA
jgi:hypothetical protein